MKKLIILSLLLSFHAFAGPTKVGNGDDGSDLEGFTLVTKGKLIATQKMAVKHLEKLNVKGIRGLGNLIAETQNTKVYLTKKNISSKRLQELGAFHSGMEGFIYARTFARPHAATRFFPAALKLSNEQLIALHIHEALHRSLPPYAREDEAKVTKITLSLIAPQTTHDNVLATVKETIPELFLTNSEQILIHKNSKLNKPSIFEFAYHAIPTSSKRDFTQYDTLPIKRAYSLDAQFYPFGKKSHAWGFGFKSEYLVTTRDENYFGPFEGSLRMIMWSQRGYDFEFKFGARLMSESNSKLKDSVYGHDSTAIGVIMNKIRDSYRLQMGIEFISDGEVSRNINNETLHYDIGTLTLFTAKMSLPWKKYEFGTLLKLYSLERFNIKDENNVEIFGKNRDQYLSGGPFFKWQVKDKFQFGLEANYLFNSNKDPKEDYLRDAFGQGMGQWKLSAKLALIFY